MISGHSTSEALKILHEELKLEFDKFKKTSCSLFEYLFDHSAHKGLLINGTHLLLMFICSCLLFASFFLLETKENWILVQGVLLLCSSISNAILLYFDLTENHSITCRKVASLLEQIHVYSTKRNWSQSSFPQLHMPTSHSISIHWTIRDSEVVGLPLCLMVEGDVILLQVGQQAPVKCSPLEDREVCVRGLMTNQHQRPSPTNQSATAPSRLQPFLVLETPFVSIFRNYLLRSKTRRSSQLENTRHQVYNQVLHQTVLPLLMIVMLAVNLLRFYFLPSYVGSLIHMIVILQIECIFPLLPTIFPFCWRLVDLNGLCQISLFHTKLTLDPLNHLPQPPPPICHLFRHLRNHAPLLPTPLNTTHILGSITSMCCVDKKGILSWPIPTAEKVFFITGLNHPTPQHHDEPSSPRNETAAEASCHVLNLTQNLKSQHDLTFDDNSWKDHLSCLKPLGLHILLNCCNASTLDKYTRFADHVNHLSHQHPKYIPVVNRRCLCELSRQIGFSNNARTLFHTRGMFALLNSKEGEGMEGMGGKGERGRRYKMPYPLMFVVNVLDQSTGTQQLWSQGTADLVLKQCTDYWDGQAIRPLSANERKRIWDFYQRTSMTSYCTAFSYKPLSPAPLSPDNFIIDLPDLIDLKHAQTREAHTDLPHRYPSTNADLEARGVEGGEKQHFFGNQVFLGMVTMQYRAVENVVNLIECLESRCIKFVHFSMENELRSRVFSEKMGLEAGWNCHISLLEEEEEEEEDDGGDGEDVVLIGGKRDHLGGCMVDEKRLSFGGGKGEKGRLLGAEAGDFRKFWGPLKSNLHRSMPFLHPRASISTPHPPISTPSNDGSTPLQTIDPNIVPRSYSKNTSLILEHSIEEINDIQNRAQLPKGIKQIRPHLEHTDNVPLQVSLFTDCTNNTTNQMLDIFHEYNEVICCMGSSLNVNNFGSFLISDCSLSIVPMFPEVCVMERGSGMDHDMMSLSSSMVSLPSTILLSQQHLSQLPLLISMASRHVQKLQRCSKIFFSLACSLAALQLLSTTLLLPPSLPPPILTWLSLVVIPVLSVSLMSNPEFSQIPYVKHGQYWEKFIKRTFLRETMYFTLRFIPCLLLILLLFALNLHHLCAHPHQHPPSHQHHSHNNLSSTYHPSSNISFITTTNPTLKQPSLSHLSTFTHDNNPLTINASLTHNASITPPLSLTHHHLSCHPLLGASNNTGPQAWKGHSSCGLLVSQHIVALQVTTLFVIVSVSNIHPLEPSWTKSPLKNPLCFCTSLLILAMQCIWFSNAVTSCRTTLTSLTWVTWCLLPVWLLVTCVIHEVVKSMEINIWIRHQKRAKLDFGTKLGMNSPF